jgi:hypothetical protein
MIDLINEITDAYGDQLDSLYVSESPLSRNNPYYGTVAVVFLLVQGDAWDLHCWSVRPDGERVRHHAQSGVLNDLGREAFRDLVGIKKGDYKVDISNINIAHK